MRAKLSHIDLDQLTYNWSREYTKKYYKEIGVWFVVSLSTEEGKYCCTAKIISLDSGSQELHIIVAIQKYTNNFKFSSCE